MLKTYSIMAIGVVAVAFAAVFIRLADAPAMVVAASRLGFASLVLAPAALSQWQKLALLKRRDILLTLAAGIFLALDFAFWTSSLSYTTVASSVVLVTVTPVFVAVISYFLFRERITRLTFIGIALAITGAITIGLENWQLGGTSLKGSALALLGALSITGYMIIGRHVRKRVPILPYIFLIYASGAVILFVVSFILGYSFTGYSSTTYFWVAMLALVPQLIGHTSLNWSLRYVPATMVTIATLGEPVGATALAYIILGEVPAILEIVGGVLILGGIALAFSKRNGSPDWQ